MGSHAASEGLIAELPSHLRSHDDHHYHHDHDDYHDDDHPDDDCRCVEADTNPSKSQTLHGLL